MTFSRNIGYTVSKLTHFFETQCICLVVQVAKKQDLRRNDLYECKSYFYCTSINVNGCYRNTCILVFAITLTWIPDSCLYECECSLRVGRSVRHNWENVLHCWYECSLLCLMSWMRSVHEGGTYDVWLVFFQWSLTQALSLVSTVVKVISILFFLMLSVLFWFPCNVGIFWWPYKKHHSRLSNCSCCNTCTTAPSTLKFSLRSMSFIPNVP